MPKFGRELDHTAIEFIDVVRPYSNFDFVEGRFDGAQPIRRLMSQARKAEVRTMVFEKIPVAGDLLEDEEDLRLAKNTYTGCEIHRLSWFSTDIRNISELQAAGQQAFLGYAIVKRNSFSGSADIQVYESVFKQSRKQNNFVRGAPTWNCKIGGTNFSITGFLYAQQNAESNCCAHVAVRTAVARFHPAGEMTYRAMNSVLGIDQTIIKGGAGLNEAQMKDLLVTAGAEVQVIDFSTPSKVPFQKYIYGSIESGYPAIIVFRTSDRRYHAIPVFGHTFNEDTWVPNASRMYFSVGASTRYLPSDSWLSMFVAHDDNCGSNYCIPRHFLRTASEMPGQTPADPDLSDGIGIVEAIITTLPKGVKVGAVRAEVIGVDYLLSILPTFKELSTPWRRRLKRYVDEHRLVIRPILLTWGEYRQHLEKLVDWHGSKVDQVYLDVFKEHGTDSAFHWMIELSVPELFSANLRKIGEVLLSAEAQIEARDFSAFTLARLPGFFALPDFNEASGAVNPTYGFYPTKLEGYVQLFGCE